MFVLYWNLSNSEFGTFRRCGRWYCRLSRYLELKRLTRMSADTFHIPDEMWVRIVYDFALAFRLRTISRVHILGAFTPLYLGWVASYVTEVSAQTADDAERRLEQLARAYEEGKPYLLSRWRWPDRFNP